MTDLCETCRMIIEHLLNTVYFILVPQQHICRHIRLGFVENRINVSYMPPIRAY